MNSNTENQDFGNRIAQLQEKLSDPGFDYFQLLGVTGTATSKDIENAYGVCRTEFSDEKIMKLANPDLEQKARRIALKIKRAYEVLIDYKQRAEYEKRGFREATAADEKEEDPLEIARTLYRKAKTLYTRQDFNMAISALEQSIRLDPAKPDFYYLLGVCQSQFPVLKREAEKNLLKAAELEPWNAEHWAALGMIFYSEKLFTKAESYFRKALSLEPGHELARKKLVEIVGPEKKTMDLVKEGLQKVFPSFFKKKKK
jgi:tetratricopeptide (TPR) repeat protein